MANDRLRTNAARGAGRQVANRAPADDTELRTQIRNMIPQFRLAMPSGADAEQLARDLLTVLSNTPKLAECDPRSVLGGAMTIAQLGLRPGVGALGHAWLIPFRGKAQVIIGYKGWLELVYRSGMVSTVGVRRIHEADTFTFEYDDARTRVRHIPEWRNPSPVIGWYGAATLVAGNGEVITEPWSLAKMEEHRDAFAMARDRDGNVVGPWRDNFLAMCDKTALLQLFRLLPKSTEIVRATVADGSVRVVTDPQVQFDDPGVSMRPIADVPADPPADQPAAAPAAVPDAVADDDDVFVDPFPHEHVDPATGEVLKAAVVEDPPGWGGNR